MRSKEASYVQAHSTAACLCPVLHNHMASIVERYLIVGLILIWRQPNEEQEERVVRDYKMLIDYCSCFFTLN